MPVPIVRPRRSWCPSCEGVCKLRPWPPAGLVAFVVCWFAFYGIYATLCKVNRLTGDCHYEYIINKCQA